MNRETRKLVRRMNSQRLASAAMAISAATTRPARTPGVWAAAMKSRIAATKRIVRQARPNSNLRLKCMLLHAPVKRTAAKPELGRRERDVEMMHPERPLDHLLLELFQVQRLRRIGRDGAGRRSPRQRKVVGPVTVVLGHDHRALGGMAKRPDIAQPVMRDERFEHSRRKLA